MYFKRKKKEEKNKCVSDKCDIFVRYHRLKISTVVRIERVRLVSNVLENIRMRIVLHRCSDAGNADASISLGMPGTQGRDATILSRSSIIERIGKAIRVSRALRKSQTRQEVYLSLDTHTRVNTR